ncbi:MAG: DMT family transporter [Alphaproteobacteria bacterium]
MNGWVNGFLGVLIFSASLPATRVAVKGFDPLFLTCIRASIAALLGLALLLVFRQKRPTRADFVPLIIVSFGVVIGFPLLTALALEHVTSAHSIVYIGLLPLATAAFAVLRAGERPSFLFWVFSGIGSALVLTFALFHGFALSPIGDAYMLGAILVCGMGYAEGAKLARTLGGWQVVSWALLMSLPLMAALAFIFKPDTLMGIATPSWIGLAYVSTFSMLIGFVFWYRGLAQGGIAKVGQLQLLQPFFGLMIAAGILGERIEWSMLGVTVAVALCVLITKRVS